MADPRSQSDLVLAPGEYVFALDTTKGTVSVLVGPFQQGMSGNATPVRWDGQRFERKLTYEEVLNQFVRVPEGDYVELTNPAAKEAGRAHPDNGSSNGLVDLVIGRRIVIPGPAYFPLWPRQSHKVISGHQLRSNQYLLVRVYNDAEAIANWDKAVIKKAGNNKDAKKTTTKPDQLTTGQLLLIKGTEISFYIPPTGIEVVADKNGQYVRDAVTLERMEFCILKEERGEKRYVQGPDVVFPSPTETFVEIKGEVKFKPIELTPISGLYVKVIADYMDDSDKVPHKKGDELFITGAQQAIYYPRPEHNIIKYGERVIHYAVAVPRGEGRYVLDREKGEVRLVKGPTMLLPDPRKEVITQRPLDESQVELWYPGNTRAIEFNRSLREHPTPDDEAKNPTVRGLVVRGERSSEAFAGDSLNRGTSFSQPRTITLDTKFQGAVSISPYPGYAVLIVNKSGDRRVVKGPAAILLEYDETLMPMELSTGTPKDDSKTIKTVYLKVKNNRVSDKVVEVETGDLVPIDITIAYRVHFEGDNPLKWFEVDNYVRHLTEHARSLLRNAVKQFGIEEFYKNPIAIIRDAILGKTLETGGRKGLVFEENGMRVYDVDVLAVTINDTSTANLLEGAQTDAIKGTLLIAAKERELERTTRIEKAERAILQEKADTEQAKVDLEISKLKKQLEKSLTELNNRSTAEQGRLTAERDQQTILDAISASTLARTKAGEDQKLAMARQAMELELEKLREETEEVVRRAGAINSDLVVALQAFSDRALMERVAEAMAPLAIFRNSGAMEAFAGLLKGTPYADSLTNVLTKVADKIR